MEGIHLSQESIENSSLSMIFVNDEQQIVDMNYASEVLTGFTKEELVGKPISSLYSTKQNDTLYQEMWDKLGGNGVWEGEFWNRHKNGDLYLIRQSSFHITRNGKMCYLFIWRNITEFRVKSKESHPQSHKDSVTNLPDKHVFRELLARTLKKSERIQRRTAVVFLDIHRFQKINDSFGYAMGDVLLKDIAEKIRKLVMDKAILTRLAGDVFVCVFSDCPDDENFVRMLEKISQAFEQEPFILGNQEVYLTINMGVSFYPQDGKTKDELFRNADLALSRAKDNTTARYHFYTSEMNELVFENLQLESYLRKSLKENEFSLVYQPQVDIATGKVVSSEALLRWNHPVLGNIPPNRFIPVAEESGLILPLGNWVIKEACRQTKLWIDQGYELITGINLSTRQFHQNNLVDVVKSTLEEFQLDGKYIDLEITESLIMEDIDEAVATLNELKKLGVKISIDDFGTGYSSLGYLTKFPLDTLKIDRSFIQNVDKEKDHASVASIIIHLAHELGIEVIAEGVERQEHVDFLKQYGCEKYQGYFCSPPVSADQLPKFF